MLTVEIAAFLAVLLATPSAAGAAPAAAQDPVSKEVVVIGRGATEEEARKSARQAALDQAVGALVDAETRLSNDRVVEEIISASAGFVEKFETMESGRTRDGSCFVRARVVVRSNLLKQRLVEEKVIGSKVDGESVVAEALSKSANAEEVARFLAKNLRDYPLKAMSVQLTGAPEVLERLEDEVVAGVKVEVKLDKAGWDAAAKVLREALGVVAREKFSWRPDHWRFTDMSSVEPQQFEYLDAKNMSTWREFHTPDDMLQASRSLRWTERGLEGLPKDHCIVSLPDSSNAQDRATAFVVPRRLLPEVARLSARGLELEVTLVDAERRPLETFRCPMDIAPTAFRYNCWSYSYMQGEELWQGHRSDRAWIDVQNPGVAPQLSGPWMADVLNHPDNPRAYEGIAAYVPNALPIRNGLFSQSQVLRLAFQVPARSLESTVKIELKLTSRPRRFVFRNVNRLGSESSVDMDLGEQSPPLRR